MRPSRAEAGCLDIHQFRSITDPQLFYIHSTWKDVVAFDLHATLPGTTRFLAQMEKLIDLPREVVRTAKIG